MSIRLGRGLQIDLRVVPAKSFGAALQYFTGSKDHNVILRGMAKDRGLRINEYGVFRAPAKPQRKAAAGSAEGPDEADDAGLQDVDSPNYIAGRTEEEVYATLDLPWFPPEIREARQEFAWAAAGKLPKLIELTDLAATCTCTRPPATARPRFAKWSSPRSSAGSSTSPSPTTRRASAWPTASIPTRLREQWDEIDRLNREFDDFTMLKGIECDILEKGGMDLPDDVLAEADWVIASVHYGQQQSREQITDRILGALENPHVSIIAHPTGRLINRREPYAVDLDAVFAAAAQARQAAGNQRQPGPARPGRRRLRRRQAPRHPDRHQQRRPQHRRPRRAALRRAAGPPRRTHRERRGQHAALGENQGAAEQE